MVEMPTLPIDLSPSSLLAPGKLDLRGRREAEMGRRRRRRKKFSCTVWHWFLEGEGRGWKERMGGGATNKNSRQDGLFELCMWLRRRECGSAYTYVYIFFFRKIPPRLALEVDLRGRVARCWKDEIAQQCLSVCVRKQPQILRTLRGVSY